MRVLGLPGRDQRTEQWLRQLLGGIDVGEANVVHYRHWEGGDPNMQEEAQRLAGQQPELVVAKSMGTLVGTLAFQTGLVRPRLMVLIGVPIAHLPATALEPLRTVGTNIPTLFIQQTDDVTGKFAKVQEFAAGLACCTTVEVPGSDHQYEDVAQLAAIIRSWITAQIGDGQ